MSTADHGPGAGERLGDVIRVVGSLSRLAEGDRELVARLLPAPERSARRSGAAPNHRPVTMAPQRPPATAHADEARRSSQADPASFARGTRLGAAAIGLLRSWLAAVGFFAATLARLHRR